MRRAPGIEPDLVLRVQVEGAECHERNVGRQGADVNRSVHILHTRDFTVAYGDRFLTKMRRAFAPSARFCNTRVTFC